MLFVGTLWRSFVLAPPQLLSAAGHLQCRAQPAGIWRERGRTTGEWTVLHGQRQQVHSWRAAAFSPIKEDAQQTEDAVVSEQSQKIGASTNGVADSNGSEAKGAATNGASRSSNGSTTVCESNGKKPVCL